MYKLENDPWWQLLLKLDKVPKSEYPRIWNELNDWKWPEELGEFPGKEDFEKGVYSPVVGDLLVHIKLAVGEKACLRYAHKQRGSTDQMFDDWWDSRGEASQMIQEIDKDWQKRANGGRNQGDSSRKKAVCNALLSAFSFLLGFLVSLFFLH